MIHALREPHGIGSSIRVKQDFNFHVLVLTAGLYAVTASRTGQISNPRCSMFSVSHWASALAPAGKLKSLHIPNWGDVEEGGSASRAPETVW